MSIGRTISLVCSLSAAAVIALLLAVEPSEGWISPGAMWWMLPALSIFGGLCVGVISYMVATRLVTEPIARLRLQYDRLSGSDASATDGASPPWLRPLADSVERSLCSYRTRVEELGCERRDLEIQVRVAETERHHAEAILHSIADAVLVTDAFNEIAMTNETAAQALRFNLAESHRQPIDRILHDPALIKLIKDTREAGNIRSPRHVEHRIVNNGRNKVYDVTLACVTNADREVTGVVTILRDVTREKEIAEMKSDFVSGVSHELRTPLSSIKAYVEMLVDGEADNEQTRTEFYNIIQSETNRLSRLIDNILNINRIEAGIVRVQREEIALAGIVSDAVEVMRPQARARQITISEQGSALGYSIYADKDMLYQALLNLLSNAIKYNDQGGRVTVETAIDEIDRTVTIHVSDTGVGIPREAQAHLFEKFYRVPDHKKLAKGTGLGLNLVKHVVETVHMGKVRMRSEPGSGSTFSITLPISESPQIPRAGEKKGTEV